MAGARASRPERADDLRSGICCACPQLCGIVAHVRDGRVERIEGDESHPVSRGFVCPKGRSAHELHYAGARIHRPRKRVGPRGSGEWREIPWEQALDEIAEKLAAVVERRGPDAVAHSFGTFHGADWGIGERFMNLLGSPNSVGQDKICYGPNALGECLTYGWGPTFYSAPEPGRTGCCVIWGMRPSASMPLLWRQIVAAQRAGAKLIVVDPERTREARRADLWLRPRPGSDAMLAMGLLHAVIGEGLYDRAFVESATLGFAELEERVRGYSPERVSPLTWIPPDTIAEAARLYARSGPAIIHGGNALCQTGRSAIQSSRAVACLAAICGNVGARGGHQLAGPPQRVVANGEAVLAGALPEESRRKRLGADHLPYLGGGYEELEEALSRAWYGKRDLLSWTSTAHEPSLWRAIATGEPYPVTALLVQYHNPLGASANARAVAEALESERLELLVVHDLFLNATSRLADYLLPAAHWLEKPYFSTCYAYLGFAGDYAEASRALLPPEHEHRSDYALWRDLGRRLGQEEQWPETIEELWGSYLAPAGLRYGALCRRSGPWLGDGSADGPAPPASPRYGTPSGKVELYSPLLRRLGCDPLPGADPVASLAGGERYPLVLTTGGRMIEGFHQNAQQLSGFRAKHPDPVVRLHPDTAAEWSLEDGEWVVVETPRGEVRQRLRVSEELDRAVVHADRWWYPELGEDPEDPFGFWATNINVCTDDEESSCDPFFGSWPLRGLRCRVRRADAAPDAVARGGRRAG